MKNKREYQERAIEKCVSAFAQGSRSVLLKSPTGSGKTYMALRVLSVMIEVMRMQQGRELKIGVIAHSKELQRQIRKAAKELGIRDNLIIRSNRRAKKSFRRRPVDVLFVDETHRIRANTYEEVIDDHKNAYLFGVSATPFRTDNRSLLVAQGGPFETMITAATYPELIDGMFICDPSFYKVSGLPKLNDLQVNKQGEYKNMAEVEARFNRPKLLGEVVKNYKAKKEVHKIKQALVFAIGETHALSLQAKFIAEGIDARCIFSKFDKERDKNIRDFKKRKFEILINIGICVEGWDYPELECVIVARPTKSYIIWAQMVGRAMRTLKGQKKQCIILDHGGCHDLFDSPIFELYSPALKRQNDNVRKVHKACPLCGLVQAIAATTCKNSPACPHVFRSESSNEETNDELLLVSTAGKLLRVGSDEWVNYWAEKDRQFAERCARLRNHNAHP